MPCYLVEIELVTVQHRQQFVLLREGIDEPRQMVALYIVSERMVNSANGLLCEISEMTTLWPRRPDCPNCILDAYLYRLSQLLREYIWISRFSMTR